MIGVIAKMTVADGKQEAFETAAKELEAQVQASEPGCTTYVLYKEKGSETDYVFMEQYVSGDALKAHGQTDYFKAAFDKMGPCLATKPVIHYLNKVD